MYERLLSAVKLKQVENRNLQVLNLYLELYVYSYIFPECLKKAPMPFGVLKRHQTPGGFAFKFPSPAALKCT